MPDKKVTVGTFRGLVTRSGKLRIQARTEKGSILGRHVSYTGDFELPGGRVRESNLIYALTLPVLLSESEREVREELGISAGIPTAAPLFRAVYIHSDGNEDWAFVIPTEPDYWDEAAECSRKTVDVDTNDLFVL